MTALLERWLAGASILGSPLIDESPCEDFGRACVDVEIRLRREVLAKLHAVQPTVLTTALTDRATVDAVTRPPLWLIAEVTAKCGSIRVAAIRGRHAYARDHRAVFVLLARDCTPPYTHDQIAEYLRRHRTTVTHCEREARKHMDTVQHLYAGVKIALQQMREKR